MSLVHLTHVPVAFLAALLPLSSCVTPEGYFDLVTTTNPAVVTGDVSAATGEFLEVVVESEIGLPSLSERREQAYPYRLGACLVPSAAAIPDDACSVDEAFQLPDGLVLTEDTTLSHDGEVTVSRGQTVTITHSFHLSAIEPAEVTVVGVLYSLSRAGGIGGVTMSTAEQRVTLELN